MDNKPANGNANPNNLPTDQGWFCPQCGGADINASSLAGSPASCNVCTWSGRVEDLATFKFSHGMGGPEEIFHRFFMDIRMLLSKQLARDLGGLLVKWGFVDTPTTKNSAIVTRAMARYIGGMAKAMIESVIHTRAAIEKEKHGKPTGE